MQLIHAFPQPSRPFGTGVRVMLLSGEGERGPIARRLSALGAEVETRGELYTAMSEILDDPSDKGLFVVDCDTTNAEGIEQARRALHVLFETGRHLPIILISSTCQRQSFPEDRRAPVELRAPLSAVSLKVGFEHALRDRFDVAYV